MLLICEANRQRKSAHENQANGPNSLQIEPASGHEFETQIAVDQPGRESPAAIIEAEWTTETRTATPRLALMRAPAASWPLSGSKPLTEAEIDRHEHQAGAMGEAPRRRTKAASCVGRYPRQRPRMTPVDEPEDAETDDQQACADLDLPLPFDERDEQRERVGEPGALP